MENKINLKEVLDVVPLPTDYEWTSLRGRVLVNGLASGLEGLPGHWEEAYRECGQRELQVSIVKLACLQGDKPLMEKTLDSILANATSGDFIKRHTTVWDLPEFVTAHQYSRWLTAQSFVIGQLLAKGDLREAMARYKAAAGVFHEYLSTPQILSGDYLKMQLLATDMKDQQLTDDLDKYVKENIELIIQRGSEREKRKDIIGSKADYAHASRMIEEKIRRKHLVGYERDSEHNFLRAAQLARASGDLERAIKLYSKCDLQFELLEAGIVCEDSGLQDEAKNFYDRAIELRGGTHLDIENEQPEMIGRALIALGKEKRARRMIKNSLAKTAFRRGISEDYSVELFASFASLAERLGDREAAAILYEKAFSAAKDGHAIIEAQAGMFASESSYTIYSGKSPDQIAHTIAGVAAKLGNARAAHYKVAGDLLSEPIL